MKSRKSYCTIPGVGVGVGVGVGAGGGVSVSKKFNVKIFYVIGKALSGELSERNPMPNITILVSSSDSQDIGFSFLLFNKFFFYCWQSRKRGITLPYYKISRFYTNWFPRYSRHLIVTKRGISLAVFDALRLKVNQHIFIWYGYCIPNINSIS